MTENIGKLKIPKKLESELSNIFSKKVDTKNNKNIVGTSTPPTPPPIPKSINLEHIKKEEFKNPKNEKIDKENEENTILEKKSVNEFELNLKCSDKIILKFLDNEKKHFYEKNKDELLLIFFGLFIGLFIKLSFI